MANNQYVNKVIYGGDTLIDLTGDDVTVSDVASGVKFHLPSGAPGIGTNTYDADTSDADATAAEILATKTAYVNGNKLTGSMPNRGAVTLEIDDKDDELTIPAGYHDGSGKAKLDPVEKAKLVPGNILQGVSLFGVVGTVQPSSDIQIEASKTVTPTKTGLTVLPSSGYDALAQVVVNAIPYVETDNVQGGKTVTIL